MSNVGILTVAFLDLSRHKISELRRFLYTDPTLGALEVFLQKPGHLVQTLPDVVPQETVEQGMWIKADPIPGCVVCNVGESTRYLNHNVL